ncbi:MAG: prephenate dehydrogenase, partial [Anaerovorax sp.]|nr:prephenate dehydrogenase [Anaerovorax sp.]
EQTIIQAKKMKIICEGSKDGKEFLSKMDLIILSIYPKLVSSFLKQNKKQFQCGAIITDTTGVKGAILNDVLAALPEGVDFIFGHPMAGREKKGLSYASSAVFQGANYILTPTIYNKAENLDQMERLMLEIGFGRVKRITPSFHDEMISFTSQLPHAMAVALINSDKEGRDTGSFIGDSYRDLTRIANMNDTLWAELFLENKENLLHSIENFQKELDVIKLALKKDDSESLKQCFRKSTARREKLDQ